MTKFSLLFFILCMPSLGFTQVDFSAAMSYDWEQIEKKEKKLIQKAANNYFDKLSKNNVEGFWESCHSKLKETVPLVAFSEIGKLMAEILNDSSEIEFIDAKKVHYATVPTADKLTFGGSLDRKRENYLQYYSIAGVSDQVIAIYKIDKLPLSKVIVIKLGLENGEYKLIRIDVNTCSFNGKDANYYFNLSKQWNEKELDLPQFVAVSMAYRLSYLGKGTSSSQSLNIVNTLMCLQKNKDLISEIKKWNVNDSIFDVINISFIETKSDITPNIQYVSKIELGDTTTKKEVKFLYEYFKNKYPELVKEFGMFIFTAFEEYPALRTKRYKNFRVIMEEN